MVDKLGEKKKLFAATRCRFYIGKEIIKTCGWDSFKYLGHNIGALGEVLADFATLPKLLEKVQMAQLKPFRS